MPWHPRILLITAEPSSLARRNVVLRLWTCVTKAVVFRKSCLKYPNILQYKLKPYSSFNIMLYSTFEIVLRFLHCREELLMAAVISEENKHILIQDNRTWIYKEAQFRSFLPPVNCNRLFDVSFLSNTAQILSTRVFIIRHLLCLFIYTSIIRNWKNIRDKNCSATNHLCALYAHPMIFLNNGLNFYNVNLLKIFFCYVEFRIFLFLENNPSLLLYLKVNFKKNYYFHTHPLLRMKFSTGKTISFQ